MLTNGLTDVIVDAKWSLSQADRGAAFCCCAEPQSACGCREFEGCVKGSLGRVVS